MCRRVPTWCGWTAAGLALEDAALKRFFVQNAGVGLNPGASFGEPGRGFMRLNIGCPRRTLKTVLRRIEAALAGDPGSQNQAKQDQAPPAR